MKKLLAIIAGCSVSLASQCQAALPPASDAQTPEEVYNFPFRVTSLRDVPPELLPFTEEYKARLAAHKAQNPEGELLPLLPGVAFTAYSSLFFEEMIIRPYYLRVVLRAQGWDINSRDFPICSFEEIPSDFGAELDPFFTALMKGRDSLLATRSVFCALAHDPELLPTDPLSSFNDKYPLLVASMAKLLRFNDDQKGFFMATIGQAVDDKLVCIAPQDSEEMKDFRARQAAPKYTGGYFSKDDKKIRVFTANVSDALFTAIHESGHAYAYKHFDGNGGEEYSTFFSFAAFLSSLDEALLSKNETLDQATHFLNSMFIDVELICRCFSIVRKQSQLPTQPSGFHGLATMIMKLNNIPLNPARPDPVLYSFMLANTMIRALDPHPEHMGYGNYGFAPAYILIELAQNPEAVLSIEKMLTLQLSEYFTARNIEAASNYFRKTVTEYIGPRKQGQ
ncbi:MAG: hypothetical protein LBI30_00505 [Holosporales bacterium]|jgi:hypothetical protein|nr:hypothetical protein [Holosporales bacterium]